jgi:1-aminocyclopropane-1-carboxylate deaminase
LEKFERYRPRLEATHMEQTESLGAHLGGAIEIYAKREQCNSELAFGDNNLNDVLLVPAGDVIALPLP